MELEDEYYCLIAHSFLKSAKGQADAWKKLGDIVLKKFFIGSISLEQITEFGVQSLTQR